MTNPRIVENMDTWAHLLADKVLAKELQFVPPAVAAMACVYLIETLCDNPETILRRETMAKILEGGQDVQGTTPRICH